MDEMMWIVATGILIVIGGGIFLLFVLGGAEGLAEFVEQWCLDNPGICGVTDENSLNYQIAENSADALACAINSVSAGDVKIEECYEYYKKTTVTGGGGIVTIGGTTGNAIMGFDYKNLMEDLDFSDSGAPRISPEPAGVQFNDFITGMASGQELGLEIPQVECTGSGDDFKCNVSGFNIPENYNNWFGDAKQVVGGFGDPTMIIYYTKFPKGEDDDWQGFTPWFRTLSGVVLLSACAGRIVGLATNIGSKLMRGTGSFIAKAKESFSRVSKLLPKSVSTKLDDITKQIAKTRGAVTNVLRPVRNIDDATHVMLADDIVENAMIRANRNIDDAFELYYEEASRLGKDIPPKSELEESFKTIERANREAIEMTAENADLIIQHSRTLSNNIGETNFKRIMKSVYGLDEKQITEIVSNANLLLSNPSVKARVLGQAGAGLGAWFAAYLDSSIGKFVNEFPSSLVLHVALRPDLRKTFPLDIPKVDAPDLSNPRAIDFSYGMPVMLDRSSLQGGVVHFYSASPCMADIEITKEPVPCDNFVYDGASDLTLCESEAGLLETISDWLVKNHDCNTVKKVIPESSSRLDEVAADLASNMNSIPVIVKGVDYDKVYYPLLRPDVAHENGYLYFIFDRTAKDVTHVYANIGNEADKDDAPMEKKEYPIDDVRISSGEGFRLGYWKGEECVVNVMASTPERRLKIDDDDGCSVFRATEDDQDVDMGILEGDEVIRCVFNGIDGDGFVFQDYCPSCSEVKTSMIFYYNITSSGSAGDFMGMKILQFGSVAMELLVCGGMLILSDGGDIDSVRDGSIDVVSLSDATFEHKEPSEMQGQTYGYNKPEGLEFNGWSATFIDADNDGKPDSMHNKNCNTPAIVLKVKKEGKDSEGNNYCIKENYRSALEVAVAVGGGVASVATAFMKVSVVASLAGFVIDCGLGLWEAKLSEHNWPNGGNGIFTPSFL